MKEQLEAFFPKWKWVRLQMIVFLLLGIIIGGAAVKVIPMWTQLRHEADWAYSEAVKHNKQRQESSGNGDRVKETEEESKTQSFVPADRVEVQHDASREQEAQASSPNPSVEEIIYETFGEENYKMATAIAKAESQLNPKAENTNTNGTIDCGVFQINSIHGLKDCHDPHKNIRYAKELFDRRGWTPWVVYNTGRYLAYLNN